MFCAIWMVQQIKKKKKKKQKRIVWIGEGWKVPVGGFDIEDIGNSGGLGNG